MGRIILIGGRVIPVVGPLAALDCQGQLGHISIRARWAWKGQIPGHRRQVCSQGTCRQAGLLRLGQATATSTLCMYVNHGQGAQEGSLKLPAVSAPLLLSGAARSKEFLFPATATPEIGGDSH